jgi:hypothetical protein
MPGDCSPGITCSQDLFYQSTMEGYNLQGLPENHGVPLDTGDDPSANEVKTEVTTPGAQELYGQNNNTTHYGEGAMQVSQFETATSTESNQSPPALDLHRFALYAWPRHVLEELLC